MPLFCSVKMAGIDGDGIEAEGEPSSMELRLKDCERSPWSDGSMESVNGSGWCVAILEVGGVFWSDQPAKWPGFAVEGSGIAIVDGKPGGNLLYCEEGLSISREGHTNKWTQAAMDKSTGMRKARTNIIGRGRVLSLSRQVSAQRPDRSAIEAVTNENQARQVTIQSEKVYGWEAGESSCEDEREQKVR